MCGSGTLPIEAAMIALKQAPGVGFQDFSFLKWQNANRNLFSKLEEEARKMRLRKLKEPIFASDINPKAIEQAKRAALKALGSDIIRFEVADFFKKKPPEAKPGILIFNPPYGERLGSSDLSEMEAFYQRIGDQMKHQWKSWNAYLFSGNRDALKRVGLRTKAKMKLYNGPIECRLMHYVLY
jgi:putative N6-adenine-specific DNA methylase